MLELDSDKKLRILEFIKEQNKNPEKRICLDTYMMNLDRDYMSDILDELSKEKIIKIDYRGWDTFSNPDMGDLEIDIYSFNLIVLDNKKLEEATEKEKNNSAKLEEPIIPSEVIEVISKIMGDQKSGPELVEYFEKHNTPSELIVYPNTKWRMVNDILIRLAVSKDFRHQKILFKVIGKFTHPLTHKGDFEIAKNIKNQFDKLLKLTDYFIDEEYLLLPIEVHEDKDISLNSNSDLALYLAKKIIVESWRDDLPFPLIELSFGGSCLDDICQSLWNLYASDYIDFGYNTHPKDLMVEAPEDFYKDYHWNWRLIRKIDSRRFKVNQLDGVEIEIMNFEEIKKYVEIENQEFIENKSALSSEIKSAFEKSGYPTEFYEIPSYSRGQGINHFNYSKQRGIILDYLKKIYEQYENNLLVIELNNEIQEGVNTLRTLIALEKEGFLKIVELSNKKNKWEDADENYAKIKLLKELRIEKKKAEKSKSKDDFNNTLEISKEKKTTFELKINYLNQRLIINGILFVKPRFESINDQILSYLFKKSGETFSKKELSKAIRSEIKKDFNSVLNDLKIKGKLREYIFSYSKNNIKLNNKSIDVVDNKDIEEIKKQLEKVASSRNR